METSRYSNSYKVWKAMEPLLNGVDWNETEVDKTEWPRETQPSAQKLESTLNAEVPKTCRDVDCLLCPHADTFVGCSGTTEYLRNSCRLTVEAAVEATTQALPLLRNAYTGLPTLPITREYPKVLHWLPLLH